MNEAEYEQRQYALATSGGVCEVCSKTLTPTTWQAAHRIANTRANRAHWGSWVIDHPKNIAIVCSLKCNDACNIGNNPAACLDLVARILAREQLRMKGNKK